jgi:hypothetical protein
LAYAAWKHRHQSKVPDNSPAAGRLRRAA